MPVAVTVTVGNSGQDYSTLQAATAGSEVVDRVTNDEVITIECYNTNNVAIPAAGASISAGAAANNVTIIPAAGEDYASTDYTSTALKYDPSAGVAFESSGAFTSALVLNGSSSTQVISCQFDCPSALHAGSVLHGNDGNSDFIDCIIQTAKNNRQSRANYTNCLYIKYGSLSTPGANLSFNDLNQCTFVCPSDLTSTAAGIDLHASPTLNEIAIFGFNSATSGGSGTSAYNATDNGSIPGTNTLTSLTFADQFENVNNATQDWRLKTGNDLDGAGAGGIDIGYRIPAAIPGGASSVSADSTTQWSIIEGVSGDSDIRWSLLNAILNNPNLAWSILNNVSNDSDLRWDTLSSALIDSDIRWDLLQDATKDTDIRWGLLESVFSDSDVRWDLLENILQDADLRWSVFSSVASVFSDSDLQWSILSSVASNSDIRWDLLQSTFQDSSIQWDLLESLFSDIDSRWSILSGVFQDSDIRWNLASSLLTVINDADLRWSTIEGVESDSDIRWDLLESVLNNSDLKWAILNSAYSDLTLNWSSIEGVNADSQLQWAIIAKTENDLTLRWSIQSDTSFPDITGIITVRTNTPNYTLKTSTPIFTVKH